jgi:hypothetical protein
VTVESWLRLGQAVHGHLGWLAVAALVHPAVLLRQPGRRPRWAVRAGVGLVTVVGGLGAWLYPAYRVSVRPTIFEAAPSLGWAFERKEALAVFVVTMAWTGGTAAWLAGREAPYAPALQRVAALAFTWAALGAAAVATVGTAVALAGGF